MDNLSFDILYKISNDIIRYRCIRYMIWICQWLLSYISYVYIYIIYIYPYIIYIYPYIIYIYIYTYIHIYIYISLYIYKRSNDIHISTETQWLYGDLHPWTIHSSDALQVTLTTPENVAVATVTSEARGMRWEIFRRMPKVTWEMMGGHRWSYPLVICYITMERSAIFQWVNPLFLWWFSIAMLNYQRV